MFQFTLPCRERPAQSAKTAAEAAFQFTLPCRERREGVSRIAFFLRFQFTLPCRERLKQGGGVALTDGFNSRSRVGSDIAKIQKGNDSAVSIHAPV